MYKIDIVTTATIRPDILNKTYRYFCKNLFKNRNDYRLIINIDPIGDKKKNIEDVLNVAKKYFNEIVFNSPEEPCFTKAVKWLWSSTISDYVFHLEDDWKLNCSVNIDDLIYILDKYEKICSVRLSKGAITAGKRRISPIPCNYIEKEDIGKFQLFPRLSLNPTLFRGSFVREAVKVMTDDLNPESQLVKGHAAKREKKKKKDFNSSAIESFLSKWDHSVYRNESAIIRDIGVQWRNRNRIKRSPDFLYWRIS